MNVFKVIFSKDTIAYCEPISHRVEIQGEYYCEFSNGAPLFAIIKAETREAAIAIAKSIIDKGNKREVDSSGR